jgi:hypothetical protein
MHIFEERSAGTPAVLTEVFHGFFEPLQVNAGRIPQLGHESFLPNPFQFIIIYEGTSISNGKLTGYLIGLDTAL